MAKSNNSRQTGSKSGKSGRNYRRARANEAQAKNMGEASDTRGGSSLSLRSADNLGSYNSTDLALHNKMTSIYNEATKIPFDQIYGAEVVYPVCGTYDTPIPRNSVPLVMGLDFLVGPGSCKEPDDPLNRSLRIMMSDIYAKTTGGDLSFTQPSLGMFFTEVDSIICYAAFLGRALRAIDFWNSWNYGYPRVLIEAMGFEYEELKAGRVDFLAEYNSIIASINNMMIPNFFDIYKFHYAFFSRVFLDEDSAKGQMYLPMLKNLMLYDDENDVCIYEDIPDVSAFRAHLDKLTEMVQSLQESQTFYRINGALLRAYKDAEFMQLPYISIDDTINPMVDPVFLEQIRNANLVTFADIEPSSLNITQSSNFSNLVWDPRLKATTTDGTKFGPLVNGEELPQIIYASTPEVSGDHVMLMTRLMTYCDSNHLICGPMMLVGIHQWHITPAGNIAQAPVITNQLTVMNTIGFAPYVAQITRFRVHPPLFYYWGSGDTMAIVPIGDVYNYTYLSREQYKSLKLADELSLWLPYRPQIHTAG